VRLHGFGNADSVPDTNELYTAVAVNDVVCVNESYPYTRGITTYIVNAADCSVTDQQYFTDYHLDDTVTQRFISYLNALADGSGSCSLFSAIFKMFQLCLRLH